MNSVSRKISFDPLYVTFETLQFLSEIFFSKIKSKKCCEGGMIK